MLGRHEGEERKGRAGYTADSEDGRRGLTAPAATPRGATSVVGAPGFAKGYSRPDAASASYAVYHIAGEGLWNASLFSEASGAGPSKGRRPGVTGCPWPDPDIHRWTLWWPGASRRYHCDRRIGVAELHTARQVRPTEHAESEGAA